MLSSSQRARQHELVVHWARLVVLPTPLITRVRVVVTTPTQATKSLLFEDGAEGYGLDQYGLLEKHTPSLSHCI
jgi:hypothetical protein